MDKEVAEGCDRQQRQYNYRQHQLYQMVIVAQHLLLRTYHVYHPLCVLYRFIGYVALYTVKFDCHRTSLAFQHPVGQGAVLLVGKLVHHPEHCARPQLCRVGMYYKCALACSHSSEHRRRRTPVLHLFRKPV